MSKEETPEEKKLREDWEIFLADIDGAGEWRVTYDIQHDLYPQFVTPDTLLYVKGEARHRRFHSPDREPGPRSTDRTALNPPGSA